MIRILTNLNSEDIPPLPGLESEIIENPAMSNKVVVLKYDEQETLVAAIKLLQGHCKVIQMTDYKNAA